ncbi:unnamed protein product [Chrysodeixis includens]|uniref:Uncharacterized protein n=1 Tax=Chrysodeixis includens TaxID=689277 RepID=A0A9N8KWU5_CHRIL|nr:unnamed protein product [Chrysodeixis includens]
MEPHRPKAKPDLMSIYRLQFYKKKNDWKLTKKVKKPPPSSQPAKSESVLEASYESEPPDLVASVCEEPNREAQQYSQSQCEIYQQPERSSTPFLGGEQWPQQRHFIELSHTPQPIGSESMGIVRGGPLAPYCLDQDSFIQQEVIAEQYLWWILITAQQYWQSQCGICQQPERSSTPFLGGEQWPQQRHFIELSHTPQPMFVEQYLWWILITAQQYWQSQCGICQQPERSSTPFLGGEQWPQQRHFIELSHTPQPIGSESMEIVRGGPLAPHCLDQDSFFQREVMTAEQYLWWILITAQQYWQPQCGICQQPERSSTPFLGGEQWPQQRHFIELSHTPQPLPSTVYVNEEEYNELLRRASEPSCGGDPVLAGSHLASPLAPSPPASPPRGRGRLLAPRSLHPPRPFGRGRGLNMNTS